MMMKRLLILLFAVSCGAAQAQQPIGSVAVQDATVAGNLSVSNGRAVLVGNTTVTAKDRTADVSLNRGGSVLVCATSGLHITSGKSGAGTTPLMLSLDRGAIEVRTSAITSDVVMTPDLRFGIHTDGPLDLRLRVAGNGDTCVENHGANAPTLSVADQFGESSYNIRPGQHVLFEHGSLKEVVDNESAPCGCPSTPANQGVSLADAAISSAATGGEVAKKSAAEQHPFPAAISDGLAPAPSVPQAPTGTVHAQVATTLSYSADEAKKPATSATPAAEVTEQPTLAANTSQPEPSAAPVSQPEDVATAQAPPPPNAPPSSDLAHWVGRFFKKLFGRR
jgi:hypothetical protein